MLRKRRQDTNLYTGWHSDETPGKANPTDTDRKQDQWPFSGDRHFHLLIDEVTAWVTTFVKIWSVYLKRGPYRLWSWRSHPSETAVCLCQRAGISSTCVLRKLTLLLSVSQTRISLPLNHTGAPTSLPKGYLHVLSFHLIFIIHQGHALKLHDYQNSSAHEGCRWSLFSNPRRYFFMDLGMRSRTVFERASPSRRSFLRDYKYWITQMFLS